MEATSAVIFLPDDRGKTGLEHPLMLQKVLGAPLLGWLGQFLYASGVERFFLLCHDRYAAAARGCLPEEAEVMTAAADSNPADLLHVFLSTAEESEEEIVIIAGAAVYLPGFARREGKAKTAPVYSADRELLMAALDENFSFSRFLRDNCSNLSDFDGYFAVDSLAAAMSLGNTLRREQMLRLIRQGVEIYDPDSCYIEPCVRIESGAKILPGAILSGNTIIRSEALIGPYSVIDASEIGERCRVDSSRICNCKLASDVNIGPYAHLRDGAVLEKGVKIGNFVEVKNSALGENTWASHLSYLGDARVGRDCNFGCGTVTVNFDRVEKFPTCIGDGAFIGCNSALVAPVTVGEGAYVAAGSTLTADVPDHALAIARSRQTVKKDWALKHKLPKNK